MQLKTPDGELIEGKVAFEIYTALTAYKAAAPEVTTVEAANDNEEKSASA